MVAFPQSGPLIGSTNGDPIWLRHVDVAVEHILLCALQTQNATQLQREASYAIFGLLWLLSR